MLVLLRQLHYRDLCDREAMPKCDELALDEVRSDGGGGGGGSRGGGGGGVAALRWGDLLLVRT